MTGKCGLCKINDREVRLWIAVVQPLDGFLLALVHPDREVLRKLTGYNREMRLVN